MKRKLIKQGQGGYTITLPINWIREFNLKPGAEINLNETEEGLLLSAQLAKRERSIDLDITTHTNRMILNLLNQSYRLGYDIINIKCKDNQKEIIEEITNTLLGFEITETKKSFCTIQNIAEPDAEKFEIILRKMFLQVLAFSEEITKSIGKKTILETNKTKASIDKLTNYLRRTIIRSHYGGNKSAFLYTIISKQSLISHSYFYLYQYYLDHKPTIQKENFKHFQQTTELVRKFYEAYYRKDLHLLAKIDLKKSELFNTNNQLLAKNKGHQNILLTHAKEIIRLTQMSSTFATGYYL